MSEVKVNKISPRSGTDVTLGDASDTFTLPSSAEIDIASGATLDVNGTIDVTGSTVTGLSATDISSGTLGTARLGTGSASSSTFLRGDQSWAAAGGDNTPRWWAVMSADQSGLSDSVITKVEFDTEVVDSDGAYDSTTNYRFTVPVGAAGQYFVFANIHVGTAQSKFWYGQGRVYLNGSNYMFSQLNMKANYGSNNVSSVSGVLDLSEGDYLEAYGWVDASDSTNYDIYGATARNSGFGGFKLI